MVRPMAFAVLRSMINRNSIADTNVIRSSSWTAVSLDLLAAPPRHHLQGFFFCVPRERGRYRSGWSAIPVETDSGGLASEVALGNVGRISLIYVVRWRQRTVQGGGSLTSKRLATLAHRRSLSSGDFWPALFISCLMPSRHCFGGSRKS